jgi:hypothetical protein
MLEAFGLASLAWWGLWIIAGILVVILGEY